MPRVCWRAWLRQAWAAASRAQAARRIALLGVSVAAQTGPQTLRPRKRNPHSCQTGRPAGRTLLRSSCAPGGCAPSVLLPSTCRCRSASCAPPPAGPTSLAPAPAGSLSVAAAMFWPTSGSLPHSWLLVIELQARWPAMLQQATEMPSPARRRSLRAGWLNQVTTLSCHFFRYLRMLAIWLFGILTPLPCRQDENSSGDGLQAAAGQHPGSPRRRGAGVADVS